MGNRAFISPPFVVFPPYVRLVHFHTHRRFRMSRCVWNATGESMSKSREPEYSVAAIIENLEQNQSAGWLAATVAAFWPTIKDALVEYAEKHPDLKVKALSVLD